MPVDVQQSRRGRLPFTRNQQQGRRWLHTVQIENQPLQRIVFVLFLADELRWPRLMLPRQIAQEFP